jgi:hypothetical protein
VNNPVDDDARAAAVHSYSPDLRLTVLAGVGAVIAGVVALIGNDAAGRLLSAVAALVLVLYLASDLAFRPRLVLDAAELRICTPTTRAALPWPAVDDVRVDVRLRFGLRATTLEIDAGETLVVFSRRALGVDPAEVADAARPFLIR